MNEDDDRISSKPARTVKMELYRSERYMKEGISVMKKKGFHVEKIKEIKRGKGKAGEVPNSYMVYFATGEVIKNPITEFFDKTKKALRKALIG